MCLSKIVTENAGTYSQHLQKHWYELLLCAQHHVVACIAANYFAAAPALIGAASDFRQLAMLNIHAGFAFPPACLLPLVQTASFKPRVCTDNNYYLTTVSITRSRLCLLILQAFAIQSYVTGEGPYANWSKHVADPFGYNLLTIVGNEERLPTL